jgi:hypothetical protein
VEIPKLLRDFQARWKSPAPWDFSSERLLPPTASPTNSAIEPKLSFAATALLILLTSPLLNAQKVSGIPKAKPATPQAVCKFIVDRMNSSVPQVPNLCSGSVDAPSGSYEITFTSSKDVLEGDLRRGWSSALFQTLEEITSEPSLNGACASTPTCYLRVSDSYLSRHNLDYWIPLNNKSLVSSLKNIAEAAKARQLSDDWYLLWWAATINAFKEPAGEDYRSKENADLLAREGCRQFIDSILPYLSKERLPECSVLTSSKYGIFIQIQFPNALDAMMGNSMGHLSETFGRVFDATAYSGAVALRSPWWESTNGDRTRVNKTYDLSHLELSFEEVSSGSRDAAGAEIAIISRFGSIGQTSQKFLSPGSGMNELIIRNVALVRSAIGENTIILDTSDGAEWQATFEDFSSCAFQPGDAFMISVVPGNDATLSGTGSFGKCQMKAKFVRGW